MSLVKIVLLASIFVVGANAVTVEEREAMYAELISNCKAQEGATDADIQEVVTHQLPSTRSGQCLNACTMETAGMLKDGKLSVEGCIRIAEMIGDPARVKNVELVSNECASTVGADRCDTAFQIMQCVGKSAVAHGLDPLKDLM